MDGIVNLSPDDPRAQEAIYNLLGTTLSELKEIDRNVVGSSRNISALKTNLNDVLNFTRPSPMATTVNAGINVPQHSAPPVLQPVITAHPTVQAPMQQTVEETKDDPNQLVFDFNQKITPDTINNKLDRILEKLETIANYIKV